MCFRIKIIKLPHKMNTNTKRQIVLHIIDAITVPANSKKKSKWKNLHTLRTLAIYGDEKNPLNVSSHLSTLSL